MKRLFLSIAIIAFISPTIAQQTYRWVDSNGQVHYSSERPTGQNVQTVNIQKGPKTPAPKEKTPQQIEAEKQAPHNQQLQQKAAQDSAQIKEACENMRKNLATYQNYPQARINIDGEIRRLTEEERNSKVAELQKSISENCQNY